MRSFNLLVCAFAVLVAATQSGCGKTAEAEPPAAVEAPAKVEAPVKVEAPAVPPGKPAKTQVEKQLEDQQAELAKQKAELTSQKVELTSQRIELTGQRATLTNQQVALTGQQAETARLASRLHTAQAEVAAVQASRSLDRQRGLWIGFAAIGVGCIYYGRWFVEQFGRRLNSVWLSMVSHYRHGQLIVQRVSGAKVDAVGDKAATSEPAVDPMQSALYRSLTRGPQPDAVVKEQTEFGPVPIGA